MSSSLSAGSKASSLDGLLTRHLHAPESAMDRLGLSYEELAHLEDNLSGCESTIVRQLAQDLRMSSSEQLASTSVVAARPGTSGGICRPREDCRLGQNVTPRTSPRPRPDLLSPPHAAASPSPAEVTVLRLEMDALLLKVARLHKLETEVENIQQLYLSLLQSTNKREVLEGAMRSQLEREKQALMQENHRLREQMETMSSQISSSPCQRSPVISEEEYKMTIRDYQMAVARLTAQNKELVEGRKRQDIELAAQRATLDEQRNHINILDSALTSAQTNQQTLEEELKKRSAVAPTVDDSERKVRELQQSLVSLRTEAAKREQLNKRARSQLEDQLTALRNQLQSSLPVASSAPPQPQAALAVHSDITQLEATVRRLELQLREKDSLLQTLQIPSRPPIHSRTESQIVKDSVSGSSASTADLRPPPRPKSAASIPLPKSQLWQV